MPWLLCLRAFYKYLEQDGERGWCVTSDMEIWRSNAVGETWEDTRQLQSPPLALCVRAPCAVLLSPPPCTESPYQLPCLLHLCTRLSPSPAALVFWKMEKEGKEARFRDGCRQRDGKGNRGRDEASRCFKLSRIKLQTVQGIDKSFHVAVSSINF